MKTIEYPTAQIRRQFWEVIELLSQQESAEPKELFALPFLLTAMRLPIVASTAEDLFERAVPSLEGGVRYQPVLARLTDEARQGIWRKLQEMRLSELPASDFVACFDFAVNALMQAHHSYPRSLPDYRLAALAAALCATKPGADVLNLHAGTAELASFLAPSNTYFGWEAEEQFRAIGALRLRVLGRPCNAIQPPATKDGVWPHHFGSVVSLGFSFRDYNSNNEGHQSIIDSEVRLIQQVLSQLSPDGKAVVAVSLGGPKGWGILGAYEQREFRRELVESGILTTVVALPSGFWNSLSIMPALLILDQAQPHPGEVRLVCPKDWRVTYDYMRWETKDHVAYPRDPLNDLNDLNAPSAALRVSAAKLAEADYMLVPPLYDNASEASTPAERPLGELVRVVRRQPVKTAGKPYGVIGARELQASSGVGGLHAKHLIKNSRPTDTYYRLVTEALLVTLEGPELWPTTLVGRKFRWNPNETDVTDAAYWLKPELLALTLTDSQVTLGFLATELKSAYVAEQLAKLRAGKGRTARLKTADLLRVSIRVPSPAVQLAQLEASRAARVADETREQAERRAQKREAFEQLRTLKHAMGRPLAGLNGAVGALTRFLERQAVAGLPVPLDSPLTDHHPITVADTLNAMMDQLGYVGELLNRSEAELVPEDYPKTWLDIGAYLDRLVARVRSTNPGYRLTLRKPESAETIKVEANEHLLDMLFGHILDNATRHGFADPSDPRNEVRIEVVNRYEGDYPDIDSNHLDVLVMNNGQPLPGNFDVRKLTRKHVKAGATGNTGIGGYEVQQILTYFGTKLQLISALGEEWPVKYAFDFSYTPAGLIKASEEAGKGFVYDDLKSVLL